MKRTVLDFTQTILSSINGDEVNSISDTTESMQVAEILKTCYFNMISRTALPSHKQLIQLDPSIDIAAPVLMYVPAGIGKIEWLKYFNSSTTPETNTTDHDVNTDLVPTLNASWATSSTTNLAIGTGSKVFTVASSSLAITVGDFVVATYTGSTGNYMTGTVASYVGTTLTITVTTIHGSGTYNNWSISGGSQSQPALGYQYVTILPIQQFIDMVNTYVPTDENVESFTFADNSNGFNSNYTFYFRNDRTPCYCTVLSDYYVIFDSYDNTQDSTLQASKTMAYGLTIPAWEMVDTFVPNLEDEQVALLLNEAKSLAYFELRQLNHPKAEQEARRGWTQIQRKKFTVDRPTDFEELPDFGRRRSMYGAYPFLTRKTYDRY